MKIFLFAAALFAVTPMIAATPVMAAGCRDAAGKFIKCPVAAPVVVKDKTGKCHVAAGADKGKFIKCP